ncbi:MAG TPA: ATP-binding protein [Ktedonobacterales bacterium]|nr:ATP-binding protein [Ktedonobacterales bacterium]
MLTGRRSVVSALGTDRDTPARNEAGRTLDAVQFGRWLGERRHAGGWPSQRAFVEAARAHPMVSGSDLSEAFLARLEAGHLAHPFRGAVRQRVLALAWLLCKVPRDVRIYLRVAGLVDLGVDEAARIERLLRRLGMPRAVAPRILPARPSQLIGRRAELDELIKAVLVPAGGIVAVTGLPGVGKSALVSETCHQLAGEAIDGARAFPDGIVYRRVADCRGASGLTTVLRQIARDFGASAAALARPTGREDEVTDEAAELEHAAAQVRQTLGHREVLIVLDDVDPAFPLREALDALLARDATSHRGTSAREAMPVRRGVLFSSRFLPPPPLMAHQLRLAPLAPSDAVTLFTALAGHSFTDREREHVALTCAALGHLPLAIEVAATAMVARGIPLDLLAAHVSEHPLDTLLDGEGELHALFAHALEPLSQLARHQFALLGALGAPIFGIEWAAALPAPPPAVLPSATAAPAPAAAQSSPLLDRLTGARAPGQAARVEAANALALAVPYASIARTAVALGQLVRHSLLDMTPGDALASSRDHVSEEQPHADSLVRYQIHPLIAAYARERLDQLDPEIAEAAYRDAREYALAFAERHHTELSALEREREMLLGALTRAWQRHEFAFVIPLVSGLWPVVNRIGGYALSARILYWGISASQQLNDQYHQARFLNRLGALLHYHGEPARARQTWEASLAIAEVVRRPADIWHPLANLAMLACEAGEMDRAQRCVESYLRHGQEDGTLSSVAHALFKRGVGARLQGDTDQAHADLSACIRLLALRSVGDNPTHDGIFEMAAQAELARVQGDFARARHHADLAVALAEEACDHFTVADLLLDQARFARRQQRQEEARALAVRVVEVATRVEAHQLRLEGLSLLRQLPDGARA